MSDFVKAQMGKSLMGLLIMGFVIICLWAVALRFLPDGWWITAINVIGFIASGLIIGIGSWQTLRLSMPSLLAFILAVVIWLIVVVLIRSLILELLGVI